MTVKENDDEEEKNYTTNEMMTCGTSTKMFLPFDILELNFQAKTILLRNSKQSFTRNTFVLY